MSLFLDFGAIKSGGGVQLSLNFIDRLSASIRQLDKMVVLVPENSELLKRVSQRGFPLIVQSPVSYPKRVFYEYFTIPSIIAKFKVDTIFTFFGTGLIHPKSVKSLVGVAYPIICYPDSPYWRYLGTKQRLAKKAINYFRRQRLKRASLIIVETDIMKNRLLNILPFESKKVIVIPPSPSDYIQDIGYDPDNKRCNLLLLSGRDLHKNLARLYPVAKILLDKEFYDFKIILSITQREYINLLKIDQKENIHGSILENNFVFLGPVAPENIMTYYNQADFLVSLSDLESFSNNYMEAWKAGIPLIVSDRDFAHHICGDSAVYVEPHDPFDIADTILNLFRSSEMKAKLIAAGKKKLASLPTQQERFNLIMELIAS